MSRINKAFSRILFHFIPFIIFSGILCTNVQATEGGGGAYLNGADGFLTAMLPPPGLYYINYLFHYSADQMKDNEGDRIPIDSKFNVTANASRILYQSDKTIWGGNLGVYSIFSLVHLSADTEFGSISKSGLGDVTCGTVLSWHLSKKLHLGVAFDITAPVGSYNKDDIANIGRNYWTFEPIFAVTYFNDHGFELTAKFMYDFNTENNDTQYRSGQEFHFDYAAGYQTGPWKIGAEGYFYKQVTDDSGSGGVDGNRGQVLGVGPAVKFDFKSGGFVELKYIQETFVENRSKGRKFLCKLVIPF